MLIDLIATLTIGVALAGVVLVLGHLTGGRVPRKAIPLIGGLGMLGFLAWNEASWYQRSVDALPDDVAILSAPRLRSNLRPWSYLWPVREHYIAIDTTRILSHDAQPSLRLAEMVFFSRFGPGRRLPIAVRCPEGDWAEVADGVHFDSEGQLAGLRWRGPDVAPSPGQVVCG